MWSRMTSRILSMLVCCYQQYYLLQLFLYRIAGLGLLVPLLILTPSFPYFLCKILILLNITQVCLYWKLSACQIAQITFRSRSSEICKSRSSAFIEFDYKIVLLSIVACFGTFQVTIAKLWIISTEVTIILRGSLLHFINVTHLIFYSSLSKELKNLKLPGQKISTIKIYYVSVFTSLHQFRKLKLWIKTHFDF